MTNRADLSLIWAQDGEVADPDLDTTHPIYQPNKYLKGWIVEKEPHQWQNFLYQITDQKFEVVAEEQFIEEESDINLANGAISRKGDGIFVKSGEDSSEVLGTDSMTIVTSTNALNTKLTSHLSADNPHNDNIHQIGGYESGGIDLMFNDPTNPSTIVYHTNQRGRVHMETPSQVGTLPVAGGTFTGDVRFLGGVTLGSNKFGPDGTGLSFGNNAGQIFIDDAGLVTASSGAVRSEVTTVSNFQVHQQVVNNLFTLPAPVFSFDFRSGDFGSIGPGIFGFEPGNTTQNFDPKKGWIVADGVIIDGWLNHGFPVTWVAKVWENDVPIFNIFEGTASWDGRELRRLAVAIYAPSVTHFESLTLYPPLTQYQKQCVMRGETPQSYIRIQNDTSNSPGTAWYVSESSPSKYVMPNATAPKNAQYLGGFIMGGDGTQYSRIPSDSVWTTSDSSVVQLSGNTQPNGQQIVNILKAGTAIITVTWGGLTSVLTITVK